MEVGAGLSDFVRETGFGGCPLTERSEKKKAVMPHAKGAVQARRANLQNVHQKNKKSSSKEVPTEDLCSPSVNIDFEMDHDIIMGMPEDGLGMDLDPELILKGYDSESNESASEDMAKSELQCFGSILQQVQQVALAHKKEEKQNKKRKYRSGDSKRTQEQN